MQAINDPGVSDTRVLGRHEVTNVAQLESIGTALEFSAVVLFGSVLPQVGGARVGVTPSMKCFGGLIKLTHVEISRHLLVGGSFAMARVQARADQVRLRFVAPRMQVRAGAAFEALNNPQHDDTRCLRAGVLQLMHR